MKPIRHEEKALREAAAEEYEKYNDRYIRGLYTEKTSTSVDMDQITPQNNRKVSRNFKTHSKNKEELDIQNNDHYGQLTEGNKRYFDDSLN